MTITLEGVTVSFGPRILFENVCASFNPGNRYGLTGPNGAGKSTLLRAIMKIIKPTAGTISLPARVGMLRQNISQFKQMRVIDVVIMGNERLWKAMQQRDQLYEGEMSDEVGMKLGELEEIILDEDGYSAEANAEELLVGAGVAKQFHEQLMENIPTDLQFRALLCQALFGNPQALLLDEPTNHLDLGSIGWLESFLHNYKGTLIVVSHDRHFLNSVTTHIADIDYDTVIIYPGNYDNMVEIKSQARERQEADAKSKEKKIKQLNEFVAKFGAGTRASQVQSRMREIDKLKPQEMKKSNIQRPYIRFPRVEVEPGKIICKIEHLCKSYDHQVIKDFSLEIERGDKIGVIGHNGLGKTTLLKMIAGVLKPDKGTIEYGHQVLTSYFPQEHADLVAGFQDYTAFEWLKLQKEGLYDQDIRGVLGKMLFGGDDAFKKVSALSGGETARLILAAMMLKAHNFIVLDEPNNHLDLEAVSALGWGLNDYEGSAIVVSHDRDLLDSFATKIIAFKERGIIEVFDGTLEQYLSSHSSL